jgi:raffinose/stachyose/melibiose transport system substrate-binding protein
MKKLLTVALVAAMGIGCVFANGSKEQSSAKEEGPVTLTFMTNMTDIHADLLQELSNEYEAESGNKIEFSAPGSSYEELMKTKMSANECPDIFTTHGWSVLRYSEYLEPINDLSWAGDINPQIKPVITDDDGNMFVLPMDVDIAGIIYNASVLEEAGVNVDDIKTWADFEDACAKIKAIGKDPIHMGGKDSWTIGQFFDWAAPSFFITNEADNQRDELKAGDFSVETWEEVAQLMADMVAKGYFNRDALTADYQSDLKALAGGTAAFGFYGNYAFNAAKSFNPDAKLGMMPVPAKDANDVPTLISGERTALGVFNDSEHKADAIEFLNFLARPENITRIATASGSPAGLTTATSDLGELKPFYEKYADVKTFPYFDRAYLPSGMWDVMCATGADILAEKPNAVANAAKTMAENFNDKF